ncbi:MAG: hypothetical protein ACOYJZ_09910 [Acutalibacter sp.]
MKDFILKISFLHRTNVKMLAQFLSNDRNKINPAFSVDKPRNRATMGTTQTKAKAKALWSQRRDQGAFLYLLVFVGIIRR